MVEISMKMLLLILRPPDSLMPRQFLKASETAGDRAAHTDHNLLVERLSKQQAFALATTLRSAQNGLIERQRQHR